MSDANDPKDKGENQNQSRNQLEDDKPKKPPIVITPYPWKWITTLRRPDKREPKEAFNPYIQG
jgi:hypothetical protein